MRVPPLVLLAPSDKHADGANVAPDYIVRKAIVRKEPMIFLMSDREHERTPAPSAPVGSLLLDEQLCFALYAASRAVTQLYRPLLAEVGLTYPQYLVMLVLWERREVTIGELATLLALDYGTLSPLLKRLQATGLVARRRRADDERVIDITLTPAGAELKIRASAIPQLIVDAYGLTAVDFDALRDTLVRLTEAVATAPPSAAGGRSDPGLHDEGIGGRRQGPDP